MPEIHPTPATRIQPVTEAEYRELRMMVRYPSEGHRLHWLVAKNLLADLLGKLGRITPVPVGRRGKCWAVLATRQGWRACDLQPGHPGSHKAREAEWTDLDINHHIAAAEA